MRNERGVALLIVLLVTALLTALVFEFAYAARVDLRSAAQFRDGQRAFFLARSGASAFIKYAELQDLAPQGAWTAVPFVSGGGTELLVRWEDERGKLNVRMLNDADTAAWLSELFRIAGVDQGVLDALREAFRTQPPRVLADLRQVMSDEDFAKVSGSLTVHSGMKSININTAGEDVLRSIGLDPGLAAAGRPYASRNAVQGIDTVMTASGQKLKTFIEVASSVFTVRARATVGGTVKEVEAVVDRSGAVHYWRGL